MSFDEQFHSNQGGSIRSAPNVHASSSPSSSSSVSAIRTNIGRMGDNIQRMARLVRQLGTPKDTHELRVQLKNIRRDTTNLSRQTKDSITLLGTSAYQNADWRIQQERLRKDFETEIKRFQEVTNQSIELEKAYISKARSGGASIDPASADGGPDLLLHDPEEERQSLIQAEEKSGRRQQAIRMDNMIQYNENLIAERYEDVKQIEQDVMEINEIFRDLAVMVNDQGTKIDQISDHIQTTVDNTEAASEEVDKAFDQQKKARKRYCLLVLILLAAVVIIAIIISQTIKR